MGEIGSAATPGGPGSPIHMIAARMRPLCTAARLRLARRIRPLLVLTLALAAPLGTAGAATASGFGATRLSPAAAAYEWQYAATGANLVPPAVLRAAGSVTIAVVDTGADLGVPSLAGKASSGYDTETGATRISDLDGHGTFVASLAAGVVGGGDGMAGFGGDAKLLAVKVAGTAAGLRDVDVASGIVYAVNHGARIVNLSLSGARPSLVERAAIAYAVQRGALVVVAAGNAFLTGNTPQYPAAFLPSLPGRGGGAAVAVAASTSTGERAAFSSTGPYVSLAAPGQNVFGALDPSGHGTAFGPVALPGVPGAYGVGSGTSFAAPEVAGAAALVWAADPSLTAAQVAAILERTASGHGTWNPELGYGVIDVAAAVQRAQQLAARRLP
jgi:subtilisin family serine protease